MAEARGQAERMPIVSPSSVRHVMQLMAEAMVGSACRLPPRTLGAVQLLPEQVAAVLDVRQAIHRHGGALLANDVGAGKTFTALAVAREYEYVHIIAPATLLPMWNGAVRTALPDARAVVHLHSLNRYSRGSHQPFRHAGSTLVIIDEAHRLRNPATASYRTIARLMAGCDLLLLSATPLHNELTELHTLCALFTAHAAPNESPPADVIVRQPSTESDSLSIQPVPDRQPNKLTKGRPLPTIPPTRRHPGRSILQNEQTLELITTLPPPLPTHDGTAAEALIRIGLLRAWCSSDAALTHAVRKRHMKCLAMRDALLSGRHLTNTELRSWLVADGYDQPGFPELLASHYVESAPLLHTLGHHIDAIATLARHHTAQSIADAQRAAILQQIVARHDGIPVIAFSQYERTALALYRALVNLGGVGVLTGRRGRIASGSIDREQLLGMFAPHAQGKPPPPPHQVVRLLITTDLLAEGVNLQDAGVVVHLDLPWTDALLRQREGRCTRPGSPYPVVHVYRIAPSRAATRALGAEMRIIRKSRLNRLHVAGTRARRSAPEAMTLLRQELRQCLEPGTCFRALYSEAGSATATHREMASAVNTPSQQRGVPANTIPVAVCRTDTPRSMGRALVLIHGLPAASTQPALLVVTPGRRGPACQAPRTLLATVRSIRQGGDYQQLERIDVQTCVDQIFRVTSRLLDRQRLAGSLDCKGSGARSVGTRAHRLLNRAVSQLGPTERARLATQVTDIHHRIDALRGVGAAMALTAWCELAPDFAKGSRAVMQVWLDTWDADPLLARSSQPAMLTCTTMLRVAAMILLVD